MKIEPIQDGNSDFALVKVKGGNYWDIETPHCSKHGAMNKVSVTETGGYWRCLQGQCRAGCNEVKKEPKKKKWDWFIWYHRYKFTFLFNVERWNNGEEWRINILFWEFNFHTINEEQ